jgi:hypothetical protein
MQGHGQTVVNSHLHDIGPTIVELGAAKGKKSAAEHRDMRRGKAKLDTLIMVDVGAQTGGKLEWQDCVRWSRKWREQCLATTRQRSSLKKKRCSCSSRSLVGDRLMPNESKGLFA